MLEFSSISVSSYDAASLADHLTARSAEGWEVVAIVPAGTNVTAYLSRATDSGAPADHSDTDTGTGADAADDDIAFSFGGSTEPAAVSTPEAAAAAAALGESAAVSEPSGWASAPESSSTTSDPVPPFGTTDSAASPSSTTDTATTDSGSSATDAVTEPAQQAAVSSEAAAPAGWYADPAGRFELRYWDGGQWTEHVSRAGQQYTDPPVA